MTPKRPFSGLLYIKYRVSWKIECITRIYSKSMWKVLLSNNHQSSLVVKPHFLAIHQKKGIQISIETLDKENISIWILWFLESFNSTFRYLRRENVKYNLSGEPIANIQIGTTFLLNFLNLKTGNDARARFKIFLQIIKGLSCELFFHIYITALKKQPIFSALGTYCI